MATERVSMRKTKEILRLHFGLGLGKREIGRICSVSHSTVGKYIEKAKEAGLSWPLPEDIDETALERLLSGAETCRRTSSRPLPDFEETHREFRRKGVTLQLLWLEYREKHPEGYGYTQYCEHYHRWLKSLDLSLRQQYRAGEKLFVDFTGTTVPVTDPLSGEVSQAEIFVAVLGASNFTYAEAVPSQSLPHWVGAHVRALEYFQGVPEVVIPDNLRSAVSRACRYEPDVNPVYQAFAEHYGTVVIPARVRKPKDKAKVEAGVLLVTRWILAALRNHTFFSLHELNRKIKELLERLNDRTFRKLPYSRRQLFESLDRPALKPLPLQRFRYTDYRKPTVSIDYHIDVEGHLYSVPYQLSGKLTEAFLSADTVEVFYKGRRIVTHQRSALRGAFTTLPEHMPKSHQRYLGWTPSRLIRWAEKTGPATAGLLGEILSRKPHPEQGFRSCLGILRLCKTYSPERVEAASQRALHLRAFSYRSVKSILQSGLDKVPLKITQQVMPALYHANVRGKEYFD